MWFRIVFTNQEIFFSTCTNLLLKINSRRDQSRIVLFFSPADAMLGQNKTRHCLAAKNIAHPKRSKWLFLAINIFTEIRS